jgi:hypothetical protein
MRGLVTLFIEPPSYIIHNIDSDDGDGGDIRNVDFSLNIDTADSPSRL